jgi:ribosomal protein S18 acetylase RimI-like enzyme
METNKATIEDIPAILKIGMKVEAFRTREKDIFWTESQLRKWIEADQDVLLTAKDNGKLVGFVLTSLHTPTGKATWENLYVLPEYRGKGVASKLIDKMVEQLKQKGATYVFFAVNSNNKEELEYFVRRGFEKGFDFSWFGRHL